MPVLLPQLIDRAAARDAEHVAFCAPGRQLTYGGLVTRAHRLAHHLVDVGVQRGDRVGILMPRCLESAVAVYGILEAGAAFVPLDPHLPIGGLRQLIDDCGIAHVIAEQIPARRLTPLATAPPTTLRSMIGPSAPSDLGEHAGDGTPIVFTPWAALDDYPGDAAPDVAIHADDLAYIMYSSGSTGRPKGLMHTHASGMAYARLSVDTYDVGPHDRIGNHSPLHFDMSTFGYLSSPFAGATTLLVPEAYTKMPASLSQLMADEGLTIWYSVPLALIQLLTRGVLDERDLTSLRWVLFGGEPFARQHLRALMQHWPQARFSNVYGPAEVNQCTYHHVPPLDVEDRDDVEPVPIGETWAETEGVVLDDDDRPVPPGETGALAIRSPTMMRGYWQRPDLDARSFYRRPRAGGGTEVFYRTGDLVYARHDGALVYVGRQDRQVKVRSHRVDLDDIELTLGSHPSLAEAAVFPVRIDERVDHLRAAVILKPDHVVGADHTETLRRHVADVVSNYAVPAEIAIVSTLPRTTSGKIDRRRLQAAAESVPVPA